MRDGSQTAETIVKSFLTFGVILWFLMEILERFGVSWEYYQDNPTLVLVIGGGIWCFLFSEL